MKLWPGETDEQKAALTDEIVRAVHDTLGHGADSVSVAFEEVPSSAWMERVYGPDIRGRWETLTKKPGYGPGPAS